MGGELSILVRNLAGEELRVSLPSSAGSRELREAVLREWKMPIMAQPPGFCRSLVGFEWFSCLKRGVPRRYVLRDAPRRPLNRRFFLESSQEVVADGVLGRVLGLPEGGDVELTCLRSQLPEELQQAT